MKEKKKLLSEIGEEIKKARKAKGLTLADLEATTDLSKKQLIKIEQGKVNLTAYSLYKLVYVLELNPAKLLNPE